MAIEWNNTTLIGRVGSEIELRYTSTGKALGKFSLAVGGKKLSENNYQTLWFKVNVWGELAEELSKNNVIQKGQVLKINGRIGLNEYVDREGAKGFNLELNMDNMEIIQDVDLRNNNSKLPLSDEDIPF